MKKRVAFIDIARAFAIILVILGHISFANQDINKWIYAFHMPLFFMISGMVAKESYDNKGDGKLFLIKKISQLIIPYIIWALLYSTLSFKNLAKVLYGSHQMLQSAKSLSSLWYLPTLFLVVLIYFVLVKLFYGRVNMIAVLSVAAVLSFAIGVFLPRMNNGYPLGADIALVGFSFYCLGRMVSPLLVNLSSRIKEQGNIASIIILFILAVVCFSLTFLYRFNLTDNDSNVLMAEGVYGNPLLFALIAVGGSFAVLFLSVIIDRFLPQFIKKVLCYIGMNTFVIFAVHKLFVNHLFKPIFEKISMNNVFVLIIVLTGTLVLSCVSAIIINLCAPILAGKDTHLVEVINSSKRRGE